MIIPVRCFTCGKVIGNKYDTYFSLLLDGRRAGEALNELGLKVRRRRCALVRARRPSPRSVFFTRAVLPLSRLPAALLLPAHGADARRPH
jgi:DNA-directed RNA polymerase subunit N (RpoN/RPB10)